VPPSHSSVVLPIAYCIGLFFTLKTHTYVYTDTARQPGLRAAPKSGSKGHSAALPPAAEGATAPAPESKPYTPPSSTATRPGASSLGGGEARTPASSPTSVPTPATSAVAISPPALDTRRLDAPTPASSLFGESPVQPGMPLKVIAAASTDTGAGAESPMATGSPPEAAATTTMGPPAPRAQALERRRTVNYTDNSQLRSMLSMVGSNGQYLSGENVEGRGWGGEGREEETTVSRLISSATPLRLMSHCTASHCRGRGVSGGMGVQGVVLLLLSSLALTQATDDTALAAARAREQRRLADDLPPMSEAIPRRAVSGTTPATAATAAATAAAATPVPALDLAPTSVALPPDSFLVQDLAAMSLPKKKKSAKDAPEHGSSGGGHGGHAEGVLPIWKCVIILIVATTSFGLIAESMTNAIEPALVRADSPAEVGVQGMGNLCRWV